MPLHNDQEVVAAFNSCLDLEKFRDLPDEIKKRIKELFLHHRVKMVCFFPDEGFGLRVYNDEAQFHIGFQEEGDEATVQSKDGENQARIDLEGYWVRCPSKLYAQKKEYVITDQKARKFWRQVYDENEDRDVDDWYHRADAKILTDKDEADAIAKRVNGIVVEA